MSSSEKATTWRTTLIDMDITGHAGKHTVLQDARRQRYFLPHSEGDTASQTKSQMLPSPDVYNGDVDVMDLRAAVLLDKTSTPSILAASMVDTRPVDLTMPSVEPVLIASPTASISDTDTPASPELSVKPSAIPSKAILDRAADLTINDARGQSISFKELYRAEPGQKRRVMVIFIRHFFCGNCQEFLRTLVSQIPPTSLPANTSIAFIGCGSHTLIPSYTELTSCPYPIYADPTKRLFDVLGMQRSLSLGWNAPDYIHHTLAAGMVKSIVQGLKRIPAGDVTKAGDLSQNGGEYLFEVEGQDNRTRKLEPGSEPKGNAGLKVKVTFCHRMRNTRDHTEIPQLVELLGSSESNEKNDKPTASLERRRTLGGPFGNLARSLSNKRQSWLERRNSSGLSRTRRRVSK